MKKLICKIFGHKLRINREFLDLDLIMNVRVINQWKHLKRNYTDTPWPVEIFTFKALFLRNRFKGIVIGALGFVVQVRT